MTWTGCHVTCGAVNNDKGPGLFGAFEWSELVASPGTTSNQAPRQSARATGVFFAFEIRSTLDVWVSMGPTPDATNGPRIFIAAGETRNLMALPGDKIAWIAA